MTANLENPRIEKQRTLGAIFELDETKEFLGDMHWLLEQLMVTEPMNLRNKITHGLELNDNGYSIYFILCVIKLMLVNNNSFEQN